MCLWDEKLERCLKTYPIANDHLVKDIPGQLLENHPTVRAITLGKVLELWLLDKNKTRFKTEMAHQFCERC